MIKYSNNRQYKHIFVPVKGPENCTICRQIKEYFERSFTDPIQPKWLDNLASGNLKRHLASGKHWKCIKFIDETGKEYSVA